MADSGRLAGKRTLITGGGSGIGLATAKRFRSEGASIALIDRDSAGLDRAKESIADVITIDADISDERQVEQAFETVMERWGGLDVLVANAAIQLFGRDAPVHELDLETWDTTIAVNLTGTFLTCKYGIRCLLATGGGSVIVTASPTSQFGLAAGFDAYSASKAALINLTQTAACDLGGYNVRVNAVVPGLIETGMTKPVFDYAREKGKEEKLGYRCELRRYGEPEEVARAILFLASDEASYITGQALPVDGGNTASLNLPGMKF